MAGKEGDILNAGNDVEVTGLDEEGRFMGVLYAHIDNVQKSGETVVVQCTDVHGCTHAVIVQESSDGTLSNLVQAWGLNTRVPRVYGPVPGASVKTWQRRSRN